jgi:hypothetical protein
MSMIESFLYGTRVGGQVLYWFFLKHQKQAEGARCWEALQLRLGKKLVEDQ